MGPQSEPVANHTYTEEGTYTLRVTVRNSVGQATSTSRLVRVGDADADGDGVSSATDNCPGDANPSQSDIDGDGIGDACDAVDDRPGGSDPGDPGEPDPGDTGCRSFQIDVVGEAGFDWFQMDTYGSVCDDAGGLRLESVSRSGSILIPAGTLAVLSTLFQFQYDANSNASQITYTTPAAATVTGSFDVCALPIPPGLGKAASATLAKLFRVLDRFGGARLVARAASWYVDAYTAVVTRVVAAIPSGVSNDAIEALADEIKDVVVDKIQDLADGLSLPSNICVPAWEPTLYINASNAGPSVTYGVTDEGFPTPVVVTSNNATAQ